MAAGSVRRAMADADILLLAVADGAVGGVAQELATSDCHGKFVFHLSGSLDLTPLEVLRMAGAHVGSLHVLASMATEATSFENTWAAVDANDEVARAALLRLADELGLNTLEPTGSRARYHLAACLVGNFPQVLMSAALRLLSECGVDEESGRRALGALLVNASDNAARLPPGKALTGPIARGDISTVRRHLQSVEGDSVVRALYEAGGRIAARMVRDVLPEQSAAIEALLQQSSASGGDDEPMR